ncbi:MAG: DNA polymerase Y family protein [Planctomycetes bacterium]|nr:DNA polymerase Y family protein [Planctomycetota bacterium]
MLCLWLPNWPIQRLIVARPELDGRAVALEAPHRGGRRVVACSAEAYRRGVRAGMPAAEAEALVGSGGRPGALHLEPHDAEADRRALEQLALWCEKFSPVVGLDEMEPGEGLLLDITGVAGLFGGEQALAEKMIQALRRRHLTVRLAIAETIGAAWAVAHFATPTTACGLAHLIPAEQTQDALRTLPVEALRLSEKTVTLLGELGIRTIEQLLSLPREGLSSRLGDEVLRRIDQATGAVAEPVRAVRSQPTLQAEWLLEAPTTRSEQIEFVLQQLIEQLAGQLVAEGIGALRLQCRLRCEHGGPLEFAVGLFRPSADSRHLWELVQMQLERLRPNAAVSELSVKATATAPLECRQQQLFADGDQAAGRRQLAVLVDRLSSRLGGPAVLRPRLSADAQPELACRYVPLTGESTKRRGGGPSISAPAHRPLMLLPRPVALAEKGDRYILCEAPSGPFRQNVPVPFFPSRFIFNNTPHQVHRHWGPERIETGWWRKRGIRRDYYRVETDRGSRFWLFRRLNDGQWFLHGAFE